MLGPWIRALLWCAVMAGAKDDGLRERALRPKPLTAVTAEAAGTTFAVVVGISNYANEAIPDLNYADADAQAVAQFLLAEAGVPPDHLWQLLDEVATRSQIEAVLGDELRQKIRPGDTLLFYFAGHGFTASGGELVFVVQDTAPDRLISTGLTGRRLTELLGYLPGVKVAVFLDSCFSGAAGGRTFVAAGADERPASASDRLAGEGRFVISASAADEPAYEADALGHGLFTFYLLEALRVGDDNGDGELTFAELYHHVVERVGSASQGHQHPGQTSSGNLVVLSRRSRGVAGTGVLQITSSPLGARVYIDGRPPQARAADQATAVETPTPPLTVPAGTHRVAAYKSGFRVAQQLVDVTPGQTARVELTLDREAPLAALLLTDIRAEWAGATVEVNGRRVAALPAGELFLPGLSTETPTVLRIAARGYEPFELTLRLEQGAIRAVPIRLVERAAESVGLLPGLTELGHGLFRWERNGAVVVWVPGGTARLGTDDPSWFLALPEHEVTVAGFWMDRFEVTVEQFGRFVESTGYQAKGQWADGSGPGRENYPVANVTYDDAVAYAAWAHQSLPTEYEWERAARGPEGWLFPYHASVFSEQKANVPRTKLRRTTPVGYFSEAGGDSPYGLADLSGNVAEWTASLLRPYPGHPRPADGRFAERLRVVRGGSFRSADSRSDTTTVQRLGVAPDRFAADIGFRCVVRAGFGAEHAPPNREGE